MAGGREFGSDQGLEVGLERPRTVSPPALPDAAIARELERLVRSEQAEQRLPSLTAAVVRDGEIVWETAVGFADVAAGRQAAPDTQYRIGSITKTLTAVAVMQLRDAGRLDLEDPVDRFLHVAPHVPTIRRLLSHTSGLQREPPGEVWETLEFAPSEQVIDLVADAEQVMPPGERWHYSNLAFAVLGLVVERLSGMPYDRFIHERILGPLGIEGISFRPREPAAVGYLVQPYADSVWKEALVDTAGSAPAGQLWGTVRDLCRWAAFLARPDPAVLSPDTVAEMRVVQALSDVERWTSGHGLGLALRRDGERILVGHGGAMPGFRAQVLVSPSDRIGAAVLTNSSIAPVEELTVTLIARAVEAMPADREEWRVAAPVPQELASVVGVWFMEGIPIVFRWSNGRLEAEAPGSPQWAATACFVREATDLYRTVSGPEQGERLRLLCDADGRVSKMYWATYPLTREPQVWGSAPGGDSD